jgi:hypothetical protein
LALRKSGLDETNPIFSTKRLFPTKCRSATNASTGALELAFLGHVDPQVLSAADMEAAPSIVVFAPIQGVQCKQDLAGLAPKGCFIPAEAIECVVG